MRDERWCTYFCQSFFCQALCFWHGKQTKATLHISISSRRAQISPIRNEHNRARCPLIFSSAEVAGVLQGILRSSGRCLRKHSVSQKKSGQALVTKGCLSAGIAFNALDNPAMKEALLHFGVKLLILIPSLIVILIPSATHLANYIDMTLHHFDLSSCRKR